jgi:maltose-binding protein MalE
MKHLWSDNVALTMAKRTHNLIATKTVFNAPFLKEDPMLRYQPQMITNPASEPELPLPEMEDLYRVCGENIQSFYLGQKTARTALDDAAKYWRDVIKNYQ